MGACKANVSLRDALWACSNMFAKVKQRTANKRVLLFTNNDAPHGADADAEQAAKTKANDLRDLGIAIDVLQMARPGQSAHQAYGSARCLRLLCPPPAARMNTHFAAAPPPPHSNWQCRSCLHSDRV